MRKIYLLDIQGRDSEYWDINWKSTQIAESVRYCEIDYLRPYLLKYFPKQGKILEGGCGVGQYVIYYRKLGYDIIGVDYAGATIKRIREYFQDIPIYINDVRTLDFTDGYFKAYYSGGVIEHFEEGPDEVIKEARRVLQNKGLFIVTVPYINIARKVIDFIRFGICRRPHVNIKDHNDAISIYIKQNNITKGEYFKGYHFHEYAFEKKEIHNIISSYGFRLIFSVPIGISWGMKDFAIIRRIFRKTSSDNKGMHYSNARLRLHNKGQSFFKESLKKNIISEESPGLIGRVFLFVMRALFGHMILLVYEKQEKT